MRVFVTGATGWVGFAVTKDLIAASHQVLGLSRSDAGADALTKAGAKVQRGSLEDLDSLKRGAAEADAVVHCAFNHDFSKFAQNSEDDRRAIELFGAELAGSKRQLLTTSGVATMAMGRVATEEDAPQPPSSHLPRMSEAATNAIVAGGVRAAVVRLAPSVHGHGDHGFVPRLIAIAREKGVSAYVGEGQNRWPGVHVLDAASLYRLALERGVECGPFHGVADEGVTFKAIAEVIARRLGIPLVSKSPEEALAHFGWLGRFAAADVPTSSARTQARLGWQPKQPGLIADLDHPAYFAQ